ncbi:MAG: ABC transporter ATP-binding protein, partial [Solirubrobacterales bacterium]|nr:ABC transporter ATP-binding protein [Solirubrobacterales bacterium]
MSESADQARIVHEPGARSATATAPVASDKPMLVVKDLDVYYGRAHVLQGVNFEMSHEPVSLIGRNGMGKT